MNRKRLTVEQWRDAVLCATGQLNAEIGGKNIDPSDSTELRRTLYSHASRLKLNSMLALFDYPDPNVHSERRANTTTPSQKLFLLNSPFVVDNAAIFAKRLAEETDGYEPLLQRAYMLLYSREPSLEERKLGVQYLAESEGQSEKYLHALMIANPMLFID